ncbi:MAG: type IV secretion system DNA-binding domain-containing protein [Candidatus Andersenbacteria bacterium]|nr:type IV secretion system DNA-binding domain-containing protein [Candidatus Andersenbacteria bacterium]
MLDEITVVGQTNFRHQRKPFGIYTDDRRRHVYVIGKTGVGKTTLLENMIIQDVKLGRGLALVDPHGDVAEKILDIIPPERINDVVYFDPADVDFPVAFNPLESVDPQYKYLVASGLVSSLKKIWADSWGPRLEYILRNVILALLDYPSSTMLGIMRMLADKSYRSKVVETITDPVVKAFWVNEFANYNERFRSEAISPIQNKVGQFLSSSIIRNIVAQPKSTIDMKDIMDNGKILLINVSKGRIGEDNSALLGAMLITKLQLAAMDRASIPEAQRRDFYLYVDEFQNFATESFATILSEARKYRLNLIIAHQYITQMEEVVRDAVFGNVGTIISFRVGAFDAEYLEKEFMPYFTQTDLVNLDKYNAYIKLMIKGATSAPFSMETIAPVAETYNSKEKVLRVSRERYGSPRKEIEEKIARWSSSTLGAQENGEQSPKPQIFLGKQGQPQNNQSQSRQTPNRPASNVPNTQTPTKQENKPRQEHVDKKAFTPVQEKPDELEDIVIAPAKQEMITDLSALLGRKEDTSDDATDDAPTSPAVPPNNTRTHSEEKHKPSVKLYPATCSNCGKHTEVPFKPDPEKEVFCKECYDERKRAKLLDANKPKIDSREQASPKNSLPPITPSKIDDIQNYTPPRPPKI